MARYTCSFEITAPVDRLSSLIVEILESCYLDLIYDTGDYIMAREIPGRVAFPQLVTVEVLIDRTNATARNASVSFVTKNEELPLQVENHCQQMFELVKTAAIESPHWEIHEKMAVV